LKKLHASEINRNTGFTIQKAYFFQYMENAMPFCSRATLQSLRARFPHAGRPQSQTILRGRLVFAALPVLAALMGWGPGGMIAMGQSPEQTNALWVANATNVVEFLPSQLKSGSSAPAPHLVLSSDVFGALQDITFDAAGNLWVVDAGNIMTGGKAAPALYEFTASQLAKLSTTKNPAPAVTIKSSSLVSPEQAVFDGKGNLWVSDLNRNAVYLFMPSQISASDADATPRATIKSNPAFYSPTGITLNGDGDLYVANNGGNNIYGFKASSLPTASGSVILTPSVILDNGSGPIGDPRDMAFDGQNNLWCNNVATVVEFTASQLAKSNDPTANVTFTSVFVNDDQTLVSPNGIAFDHAGNLAVGSSFSPFGIAVYAKSQLVKSKTTDSTPATFLVGSSTTLSSPKGIAFGPAVQ
jgi:hypothetical protein